MAFTVNVTGKAIKTPTLMSLRRIAIAIGMIDGAIRY